jgi:transcriptional regulator with XRE-family HTH domain
MLQANDFGGLLRRLREAANLSQERLAELSDLDRTFVSLLERGQRQPSLETVFSLCTALEIRPHEFVRQLEFEVKTSPVDEQ